MVEVIINSLPVFIPVAVGFIFKRKSLLPSNASETISVIAFKVVAPLFAFLNLYSLEFKIDNIFMITLALVVQVFMFISSVVISKIFQFKDRTMATVSLCMIVFAAAFAYPMVENNFSSEIFEAFVTVDMIQFVTFLVVGPVIAVYYGNKFGKEGELGFWKMLEDLIKDPFFIVFAATIILKILKIQIPHLITESASYFSGSLSLLVSLFIGVNLELPKKDMLFKVGALYLFRILIVVIFVTGISAFFSLDNAKSTPLYLNFIPQFSALSVMYAKRQGLDYELANQLVTFSMVAQLFVYPVAIAVL